MRWNCASTGCHATANNWPEGCYCYHYGISRHRWRIFRKAFVPLIAVMVVVGAVVMTVKPAKPHHVVAPVAAAGPISKAIAHTFAGAGSSSAAAPIIGGAVVVGLIAYDVKKRTRCNRFRDLYVDTHSDLYPKYTPYRDVCNDPKPKRKVRGNVVRARG